MPRHLTQPLTKQDKEQPMIVDQRDFSAGMFLDTPRIPQNGVKEIKNYINHGDRLKGRPGSKEWSTTTLPTYNTVAYTYTSTVDGTTRTITKTVGDNFASTDVDNYFVHSDGVHEKITAVNSTTEIEVYTDGGAKSGATGALRGKINGMHFHKVQAKIIMHIGTKLYQSDDLSMSAWTEVAYNGTDNRLDNSQSSFSDVMDYVVVFNANGIYKFHTTNAPSVYFQINGSAPTVGIGHLQVESATYIYGYKYIYTLVRLSGTSVTRNRNTSGVSIELETAPVKIDDNGVDYGFIWVENAIDSSNPRLVGSDVTGMFRVPIPTGSTDPDSQYTHYGLYRTLDQGDNGVDPIKGKGNNTELFVWVDDVPIAKAFTVTTAGTTCTAAAGTFTKYDAGSKIAIYVSGSPDVVTEYTINSFTSSSEVVLSGSPGVTAAPAAVGGQVAVDSLGAKVLKASQTGTTVTLDADFRSVTTNNRSVFTSDDVGRMLFFADGTRRYITAVAADGFSCTVKTSGTVSNQGATMRCMARKYYDYMPDDPTTAEELYLRAQIAGWTLQNRFWVEMPSSDLGIVVPGFMFVALEDAEYIYYCQVPTNYEYMIGYYNPAYQYTIVRDKIKAFHEMPDKVVVYCLGSTHVIPINLFQTIETPEVGEIVALLAGQSMADQIGILSRYSLQDMTRNQTLVITSEPTIRVFDGYGYSDSLSANYIDSAVQLFHPTVTTSYDNINGYMVWALNDGASHGGTNISYRCGLRTQQGIGFSENSGSAFPMPESGTGVVKIVDAYNQTHVLILDYEDGLFYDVSTCDGFSGSGNTMVHKDKVDSDGAGGTDIDTEVTFGEDSGSSEERFVECLSHAFGFRPEDSDNRGADGYDASGYPTGFEANLYVYADGEETTASANASDITTTEEMVFDRKVEGHREQIKLCTNSAEHQLVSRRSYYLEKDKYVDPDSRITTEGTYQSNLSAPVLWVTRGGNLLYDRVEQETLTGAGSGTTGPDGRTNSALTITTNLELENVALTTSTLLYWCKSEYNTTFDATNSVTSVEVDNNGTWYLYCVSGTIPEDLVFEAGDVFDIRLYSSSIGASTRTYLYNDVIDNSGDATLPVF